MGQPIDLESSFGLQQAVIALYGRIDANDAPGFASHFEDDAVLVTPYGEFAGQAAIQSFMQSHIDAGAEDSVRHYLTNFAFDSDAGAIVADFFIMKWRINPEPVLVGTAVGRAHARPDSRQGCLSRLVLRIDQK